MAGHAAVEGTVVFIVVRSEATIAGHATVSRQRFLCGPVPGYITRVLSEPSPVLG
jgi:hypothetical protein